MLKGHLFSYLFNYLLFSFAIMQERCYSSKTWSLVLHSPTSITDHPHISQ